jgi:hypothetical protein
MTHSSDKNFFLPRRLLRFFGDTARQVAHFVRQTVVTRCHPNQTHSSLAPSQSSRLTKDIKLFLVQLEKSNRSRRATVFCCKIYLLFSTGLFLCASGRQLLAHLYRFDSKLNGVTGIFHVMEECQRILECCRLISYFLESLTLRVIKIQNCQN